MSNGRGLFFVFPFLLLLFYLQRLAAEKAVSHGCE